MKTRQRRWLRGRFTVSVIVPAVVSLVVGGLTSLPAWFQARAADKQAQAAERQANAANETLTEVKNRTAGEDAPQIFFNCEEASARGWTSAEYVDSLTSFQLPTTPRLWHDVRSMPSILSVTLLPRCAQCHNS